MRNAVLPPSPRYAGRGRGAEQGLKQMYCHVAGKDQRLAAPARSLRRALTGLQNLRSRHAFVIGGFKFARREPIARYYVDLLWREGRLIIELDGGQHSERPKTSSATAGYAIPVTA
jgi:very-short-patch-repair endonuclease